MSFLVVDDSGRAIDARIDVVGSSVIVHSRGGSSLDGTTRNEGHGGALISICRRARSQPGSLSRVLIDSAVAREKLEAERILLEREEIEALDGDALAAAIRPRLRRFGQQPGVKGGNSTKQVRFDFDLASEALVSLLKLRPAGSPHTDLKSDDQTTRLSDAELRRVLPIHVRHAVDRLLAGEDVPRFANSRDYDVLTASGERLAPKKVFALAIGQALGIEALPGHFSAGWGHSCFEIIQAAGFDIVRKAHGARTAAKPASMVPPEQEEQSWAEGSPKFAGHLRMERRRNPQASAAKRAEVRAQNGGQLVCENPTCSADWYAVFPLVQAEAVFEIHHKYLVSRMEEGHSTTLQDLVCLCASCHRAEHRRMILEP